MKNGYVLDLLNFYSHIILVTAHNLLEVDHFIYFLHIFVRDFECSPKYRKVKISPRGKLIVRELMLICLWSYFYSLQKVVTPDVRTDDQSIWGEEEMNCFSLRLTKQLLLNADPIAGASKSWRGSMIVLGVTKQLWRAVWVAALFNTSSENVTYLEAAWRTTSHL